jgi:hypothetical protein
MSNKQAERLTGHTTAPATPTEPAGRLLLFGRAPAPLPPIAGADADATDADVDGATDDATNGAAAAGGRTAGDWFKMLCFLLVAAMAVW